MTIRGMFQKVAALSAQHGSNEVILVRVGRAGEGYGGDPATELLAAACLVAAGVIVHVWAGLDRANQVS